MYIIHLFYSAVSRLNIFFFIGNHMSIPALIKGYAVCFIEAI